MIGPIGGKQPQLMTERQFTFEQGLKAPLAGARWLIRHPRALALCAAPFAINFFVILPLIFLLMRYLVYPWASGIVPDWDGWFLGSVEVVGRFVIGLACFAIGAVLFFIGALVLGAPFHDEVGKMVEKEQFADRPDLIAPEMTFREGTRHALLEALRRVMIVLPRFALTLLLGIIPGIGPLLVAVINFFITTSFLTLDAFSMPMDRRGRTMKEKMAWIRHNRMFALGFGLPMLIIPCAIFVMPPLAAASASLLYTRWLLDHDGDAPEARPGEAPEPKPEQIEQ